MNSRAGQPAEPRDLVDVAHLVTAYYTRTPDPEDADQQVAFGTSGHRGSSPADVVQRGAHPGHHAGDLRVPARAGVRRAAVHRPRHPRALRAGVGDRARGAGRQRRRRCWSTPRTATRRRRRSRTRSCAPTGAHDRRGLADGIVVTPVAQPARRRRLQVQPAPRRPCRHRRHRLDRGPRQRAGRRRPRGRTTRPLRPRAAGGRVVRLPGRPTSTTSRTSSTSTRCARRACASAPTRWAARAWTTGARSRSGTGST